MRRFRLLLSAAGAVALLSGCAAPAPAAAPTAAPAAPAPASAPEPTCNAESAKFAVGQRASSSLEVAARVRAGAQTSRVLKPGQAVTMEFNGARLNLVVDGRNRVTAVRCG